MANTDLYSRLKRMFSTAVVVRNVGNKKLKIADTKNLQSAMSNVMRDRYIKLYSGLSYGQSFGNSSNYALSAAYQAQRMMLFREYELMDNDPILSAALDIYSEESTVKNEFGDILEIKCEDEDVKEILRNLFYDVLNVEFNLPWWIRSMAKYGDMFLFMEIHEEYGIVNVMPLSVYDTVRLEGLNPENPYEVKFETLQFTGNTKMVLQNYEVAHFRLLSDGNFLPYGKSALESARRIYRQLTLMEDAMLIHRIMRAPEKRVYKIDIGNIPPHEVENYIQKMITKTKKVPVVDPQTGDYNLRYNMQNLLEDFYIPVRGSDSGTSIENLGGLEYNPIDDIEYLRNKMMAALKIPKAFLGYEENISGKTTLAAEDVRFARTIERVQRIVISELTKMAIIHLYAQGIKDERLVAFDLKLTTPSTIAEQEKIALWQSKMGLANDMITSNLFSTDWIYENVMNIPKDQFDEERQKIVDDKKRMFRYEQITQGQSDPAKFGFPQDKEPQEEPVEGGEAGMEGGQEMAQEGVGRPREGMKYKKDSHPRGRDPLGSDERYILIDPTNETPRNQMKSPLSIESSQVKSWLSKLDEKFAKKKSSTIITENTETEKIDNELAGTYMDEDITIQDIDKS